MLSSTLSSSYISPHLLLAESDPSVQGFGITIGSDLFYVLDRPARQASNAAAAVANSYITLTGTFSPFTLLQSADVLINSTTPLVPFNGTFIFSDGTTDSITSNLQQGSIICVRDPTWAWWRKGMPQIYLIALVPLFSLLLSLWNMQPIRSRQLPVMVVIICIGFLTNTCMSRLVPCIISGWKADGGVIVRYCRSRWSGYDYDDTS